MDSSILSFGTNVKGNIVSKLERIKLASGWLEFKEDGLPYWLVTRNSQAIEGTVAGCLNTSGYRRVNIRLDGIGKCIYAHHISFYQAHGKVPKMIDHINRNPDDNRSINLREVTQSQNSANRKFTKTGSSEFKGVSFDKTKMKFKAQINIKGKRTHLGYFKCEIEAALAYDKAALKEFGEYAYLNFSV